MEEVEEHVSPGVEDVPPEPAPTPATETKPTLPSGKYLCETNNFFLFCVVVT